MMTGRRVTRAVVSGCIVALAVTVTGCATTRFDTAVESRKWSDAAAVLDADTSLLQNENTLFQAAMLYSYPNRATYDPARARRLLERLLQQYPTTSRRQAAIDQLALLYEMQRMDNAALVDRQTLGSRIAQLEADTLQLRRSMDSVATRLRAEQDQSAVLRKVTMRLQNDLQDRESQLNALHDELNHLKAIDLRPPLRPHTGDTALKKPSAR